MPETWLSIEKVCALTGKSQGHVRRNARAWHARKSESRAPNGVYPFEFPLSSLPPAAQARHADEVRKGLAIVRLAEQALPLFASAPPPSLAPRVAIPEDLEDQARARLKAIEPYLDVQQQRKQGRRTEIRLADGKTVRTMDEFAEYIGSQQNPPVGKQAIWAWVARFNKGGYAGLADRPRKDKGQSRFFESHAAAALFLQNKYLREGLSREMAWEALCRGWKKLGEKGETPCYDTARNFLNALPQPLKVLAREGKQAYWSKCSPSIIRGKVPVMDWWISDHRVFDVMVRNTLFAEKKPDEAFRPCLTLIQDWGSKALVGFCLAPTGSSRTINSAMRMAMLDYWMPRNFYWDNGKDFDKVRRALELISLSEGAQALLTRHRIAFGVTSALPFRPRSKPIEAHFSRWSKRYDLMWGESYLGNKPGNCPEKARLAQKHHEEFLKGKRADTPLPTDVHFIAATIQWIYEFNEETRLSTLDGRTPSEVMEEQYPEGNRPQINPRLLDILFWERTKRVVKKGGCVDLDGMRYEPTDESLFALDGRTKQEVAILRDPYNLGDAIAADAETLQFIGELRVQEFVAQCPGGRITRDQIKAAMRREHGLRRGYAEYLALLSAVASNQGWKTEREELVERAMARTGTDSRLLPAAVPGARRAAEVPRTSEISSPSLDDAAAEFEAAMSDTGRPPDAAPFARQISERAGRQNISTPFVNDAVRDFLAKESKP